MSVEKDLRTYMLSRAAINTLIGTRMYAIKLKQNPTLPAVTYNRISSVRRRSHSGDSNLTRPRIQYSSFAETYEDAVEVADAIEAEMKSFSGTAESSNIYAAIVENRIDLLDPESKYYMIAIDLMIQYEG